MLDRLQRWFKAYKLPILLGSGGVVAYTAYASAQQRAAAGAGATPTVVAGLAPGEVGGLIGQGAGLAVSAQTPILGLAQEAIGGGLGLAGLAAQTAAGVAETAAGSAATGTFALADVLGQLAAAAMQPTSPSAPTEPALRDPVAIVTELYQQLLGRAPDPQGLHFHTQLVLAGRLAGKTEPQIYYELRQRIMSSVEYRSRY